MLRQDTRLGHVTSERDTQLDHVTSERDTRLDHVTCVRNTRLGHVTCACCVLEGSLSVLYIDVWCLKHATAVFYLWKTVAHATRCVVCDTAL